MSPATRTPTLSLVVPLYNEEERVAEFAPRLLDFVQRWPVAGEVVFVDDGSSDGTVTWVEKVLAERTGALAGRARLLREPHRGKGAAITAGIRSADADVIAFTDIDLATPLDEVERLVRLAATARGLVIGSRDMAGSRLVHRESGVREALGRLYNRFVQLALTPGIVDTQCGAKAAPSDVWRRVLPYVGEPGYAWDVEVIAVARRLRIPVEEVAIRWAHDERSRVRVARDGTAMVWAVPRIMVRLRRASPEFDRHGAGIFDRANAERLAEADATHWWFRSKAALVATQIRRVAGGDAGGWLVDVGAGAGGVTSMLGWNPAGVLAVEGSHELARQGARRHALTAVVADGHHLPLRTGSARLVTLLDVIEHVDDPSPILDEARRVLGARGHAIITVPAHRWLWSRADEALGHARRYTRGLLGRHLHASGLRPQMVTHVFSWLVPPVWLARRVASGGEANLGLDATSPLIDRAAVILTRVERAVIRWIRLPLGTSILAVAQPAGEADQAGP